MTILAEHMIVVGADNRPPMLDKIMYNSWKSRILLYIKGKEHGRMPLKLVLEGPLVYPTIEVDGVTRLKTYEELSDKEKLQDDCDLRSTNIVLQGLPPDIYALVNHNQVAKQIRDRVKLLMQGNKLLCHEYVKLSKSMYTTNYDQLYAYLSQYEGHGNEVCIMRERKNGIWQHNALSQRGQGTQHGGQDTRKAMPINAAFHTNDLDAFDSDYDETPGAQAVLMSNLSSYDLDVISEAPISNNYQNNVVSDFNCGVTCENEAKRRNSRAKIKTFKEYHFLLLYAVSNNEDTAYQRQLSTKNA
nr:hypothetical protein [Tanacetum cinerariifolium]